MKCTTTAIMINLVFISLIVILIMVAPVLVQATSNQTVNASIKISVCGNNIKEGGEDCDNSDLNGKTCQSLGFASGTLTCDISCSFDTSACISPTPTSTPTPSPTSTVAPTPTVGPSSSTSTTETQPAILLTPTPATITQLPTREKSSLPALLQVFDINGVGKIELSQLYSVVKLWVEDWKNTFILEQNGSGQNQAKVYKKCDINNDKICDMKDFSLLMFYVER